ncbi:Coatomer subunit beta [Spathaspora sp. JA1]|nr:Coatomer subunit beta [Spathaspora sp. JA1]
MGDVGYTLIYEPNSAVKTSVSEFKTLLEKGKDEVKIDTMKKILITILNGDAMPDLLMHIIRFIMPSRNKELKKLLYFYWEVCPKLDESGKMRHEMILVCNAIQRDLQHPNEYIRGNTLRYLTKLKEPELLETLVPNVRQCLEHRHAYVRKNAVFALYSIHKVSDHLAPDADELIYKFLYEEPDSVCKRNAFVCLGDLNRNAGLQYIQDNIAMIETLDPLLQLAFIEFIKKDSITNPNLNQQYSQLLTEIVESSSNVVVYEAANTLSLLTSSPASILLVGTKFVELATKEADNNVKIITLERINDLHKKHPGVLQELSLEILRVLNCQDLDVKKKALEVTLKFITSRNVEDVVKLLKKELTTASNSQDEKAAEYRQLLINSIHQMAIKFVEVAADVIELLLDSIGNLNTTAAYEVITFVKEVVEKFPNLRSSILSRLVETLPLVKSGKVIRGALWIIGEYSLEQSLIQLSWKYIRSSIGEVPIIASEKKQSEAGQEEEQQEETKVKRGPVVLPDGTYASESAFTAETTDSSADDSKNIIRKQILAGDFYLGGVVSSTLVKLILRLNKLGTADKIMNPLKAEALLIMVSILRVGESKLVSKRIDEDSSDRILSYIKILNDETDIDVIETGFLEDTKDAFRAQITSSELKKQQALAKDFHDNAEQVDDSIVFRQLDKHNRAAKVNNEEDITGDSTVKQDNLSSRLNKILPLTGFSDPIYAEAFIKVHQYDVVLDVLLVNQTTNTLRNLSVEFATLGDLKVVDKPATANIGPHGFYKVQTTIKVNSADTGVIFGNIVYDGQHSNESTIVILNDVHVDIMDYIKPATCTETQFRKMWNEFEWENKITIKSQMDSLKQYMDELMKGTNMNCLTVGANDEQECQFLSANLYSRSSFGEDALANLCIEKQSSDQGGAIIGHVRIRSKGQGLALSLGDRVASISKNNKRKVDLGRV